MEDFSWLAITSVDFKGPMLIKVCKGGISQFTSFLIHQEHMYCEVKSIIRLENILGPLVHVNDENTCEIGKLIVATN